MAPVPLLAPEYIGIAAILAMASVSKQEPKESLRQKAGQTTNQPSSFSPC
jgi:hypothetical protein